jgi:predicted lipoprotein with Yx(FWY)xxD motif
VPHRFAFAAIAALAAALILLPAGTASAAGSTVTTCDSDRYDRYLTDGAGRTLYRDGSRHVTYNGHPVYYYFRESRAGQIFCQNIVEFGGTWLLIDPRGAAMR